MTNIPGTHLPQAVRKELSSQVVLDVSVKVEPNFIRLQYHVKNNRSTAVYLFNVLWSFDNEGNYVTAPDTAYTCLKGTTLHVAKQVLPLPRYREVELRIVPFATKVEAGKEFSEALRLATPVQEFNPYFPRTAASRAKPAVADMLLFILQFVADSNELQVHPAPVGNSLRVTNPTLFAQLETLTSHPILIDVPVAKRLDEFEDF